MQAPRYQFYSNPCVSLCFKELCKVGLEILKIWQIPWKERVYIQYNPGVTDGKWRIFVPQIPK
jgi:hypothetical protein